MLTQVQVLLTTGCCCPDVWVSQLARGAPEGSPPLPVGQWLCELRRRGGAGRPDCENDGSPCCGRTRAGRGCFLPLAPSLERHPASSYDTPVETPEEQREQTGEYWSVQHADSATWFSQATALSDGRPHAPNQQSHLKTNSFSYCERPLERPLRPHGVKLSA